MRYLKFKSNIIFLVIINLLLLSIATNANAGPHGGEDFGTGFCVFLTTAKNIPTTFTFTHQGVHCMYVPIAPDPHAPMTDWLEDRTPCFRLPPDQLNPDKSCRDKVSDAATARKYYNTTPSGPITISLVVPKNRIGIFCTSNDSGYMSIKTNRGTADNCGTTHSRSVISVVSDQFGYNASSDVDVWDGVAKVTDSQATLNQLYMCSQASNCATNTQRIFDGVTQWFVYALAI
ncbi:MAG: hypothetical protein K2P99_05645 [Burkholderiales bacterium]|nr:hypothetical protein [Burkholderiales bacterium]